ncbi:MAG: PAS domain S-box-containing protein, partial [Oceanospirillaceae bacterium]
MTIQNSEHSNLEQLELVVDATKIGIWDWQVQTGELFFNDRWAEIIGHRLEDLQPINFETWVNCIHPDDFNKANGLLEHHWQDKVSLYEIEFRMLHKQGH